MVRGKAFYAIWDEEQKLWSTNEFDVVRIIDAELKKTLDSVRATTEGAIEVKWLGNWSTNGWNDYKLYLSKMPDTEKQLDTKIAFSNTEIKMTDYISKHLPYALEEGPYEAFDEIIGTLYSPEERQKLEWAIGSIVSGDSVKIQKFIALYGEAGTGKSTILNIIEMLFPGYCGFFDAKALASNNNAFATEVFRTNPLVAINHDGDLSRIEDNTKFNSIVSHEIMTMNEKYKSSYYARINAMLFIGTNQPVKITDSKSGLIRRLIDVTPTGNKIPPKRYQVLMSRIEFELGAIAEHCLQVYNSLGIHYYDDYRPIEMMYQTDVFFNFVEDNYLTFIQQDGVSLKQAWSIYKNYCEDAAVSTKLPMHKFRTELKSYFDKFYDRFWDGEKQVSSYYEGFKAYKFERSYNKNEAESSNTFAIDETESMLDKVLETCPAQYATANGTPAKAWTSVKTTLAALDTSKVHYVKVPENHIVIDFDLKDESGNKSLERNMEAASKWPVTYAELSKSGQGIHLHYIYDGDTSELSRLYSDGIEVKVFNGNSSLRRMLTKCKNAPIAHISTGLPMKGVKPLINFDTVMTENHIRKLIKKNLNKEIHPNTRPSIDFIFKILEDAYNGGSVYDVTDMRNDVLTFAANSTNQASYCLDRVAKMQFKSEATGEPAPDSEEAPIVFYDVEVFPNLFLVNWKFRGQDHCTRMINPTGTEVGELFKYRLIGFNCRRYDNHILYGRYIGYNNEEIYKLSTRLINNKSQNAFFSEAYNISYTDVYDFCAKKQSLKKWEIELGIHHQELGLEWNKDVPEHLWPQVAEYCDNDVIATEAVFNANHGDFLARQILADLSGLTVNDTTNSHTKAIIFGKDRNPQGKFHYWNLGEPVKESNENWHYNDGIIDYFRNRTCLPLEFTPYDGGESSILPYFPGYKFDAGKSYYRGEEVGEGGYVYAEPGVYYDVALLDIASMHPTSLECMYEFGEYTHRFSDIKHARILIKQNKLDEAASLFDGRLEKYLKSSEDADALSYALKIAINSVYGLTSAKFENQCRDPRNVDNIVAKRGALFMIDLKHEVQARGFTVAHIKTDSIKIPGATKEIIDFVMEFGRKYGYTFEHEATYSKMCLVNDSVYIAKVGTGKKAGKWSPTGAQFAQPYVFKTLFSKEPVTFEDMCEPKQVQTAIYLDMNENLPDVSLLEKEYDKLSSKLKKAAEPESIEIEKRMQELEPQIAEGHCYTFVGKVGLFTPIMPGAGGGWLVKDLNGKMASVTGASGYRWLEAETVKANGLEDKVDLNYHRKLVDDAMDAIGKYCDPEIFIDDTYDIPPFCTISDCATCSSNTECDSFKAAFGIPIKT